MAQHVFQIHRICKFESISNLDTIGSWVAVHNPREIIAAACSKVDSDHTFPLLCIMDIVLKFSERSRTEIGPHLAHWLRKLPGVADKRMAFSAAAMIINWIHHGVIDPSAINTTIASLSNWDCLGERVYACPHCRLRFASVAIFSTHIEAHRLSIAQAQSCQRAQSLTLGLFHAIEEARRIKKVQIMEIPRLMSSPLPLDEETDHHHQRFPTCGVCGDIIVKSFSDVYNTFVWENCRRVSDFAGSRTLVHAECEAADYLDSTLSSGRAVKRIKLQD